jgi:acetolactate synthase-1/2/3 large subunit
MKASDLFAQCLENEGVDYIFGMAGEENLDLLESIRKTKIKYIPVRHEQAAGFMAATYGRLTGKPGVCLSTLGPGATNFVTPAAYAKLGGMPMIMITGQKPLKDNKQGDFQIIDIVNMMRPITEMTTSISFANKIPSVIRESFRVAHEERPGPVHIELPKDVAVSEIENTPLEIFNTRRSIAEVKAIERAVEMIKNAKSPLILIGAGANRKITSKTLTEFINKTGIYFVDTQMGKGVVDERHEKFIGTCALTAGDYVHCAIEKADLIINVGHDIIEKSPFLMKNDGRKVIHINFSGAQVSNYYFPQLEVVGDIANAIWQIMEKLEIQTHWDFEYFKRIKNEIEEKVYSFENILNDISKPQQIVDSVRNTIGEDGIICLDNGMYKLWFARQYKAYKSNTILLDNALATMGAGLPSGITTKLLNADKKVLVVTGDGGFMMNSQEIETAVRLGIDLTVLIINDSGLGMIQWEQDEKGFDRFGLSHNNPDFVKYAESYGAKGYRVDNQNGQTLTLILKEALNSKGVNLIDCPVDYSENQKVFVEEIHNISCPL